MLGGSGVLLWKMVFSIGMTSSWYSRWQICMKDELADSAKKAVRLPDWKFDDARMPTEIERQRLARLIYLAFIDIRIFALDGRVEQARDLADAFHNVPLLMYSNEFSFK